MAATGAPPPEQLQAPPARVVERLNPAVQQQLNLESVKTRAVSLFKAITRILEDLDAFARANSTPKWQDVLSQFSMVNLELYNIVEDIKSVSKAFIVNPKFVTAETATVLPVMLSSKLLPEMEAANNTKTDQLLHGLQNLPVAAQIDKLKTRINMIASACESAEKIIAEARKAYFGTRQGPTLLPTIDKVQAAKIQEQESLLRNAVNHGEGLRIPPDQRRVTSSLPMHLVDILTTNDVTQSFQEPSGMYQKSTPPLMSTAINNNQASLLQPSGAQVMGRPAASPSTGGTPFDNTTASPLQYANSPRSGANMMNTPSPQQQSHQQQQPQQLQQHQLQQRKMMQLPPHQQQQLLAQQQLRQSSMPGLGQNQQSQLQDLQNLAQQKYQMHGQHPMQFSQALAAQQQLQGRQLTSGAMHMGSNQLTQGNQLNRQLNQFSSPANSALYNAAQTTPTSQMISNMSAMMPSQSVLPRMQFGMPAVNRSLPSQNLSDQMYNMGAGNAGGMMQMQQQQPQLGGQSAFGNMQQQGVQNLQQSSASMMAGQINQQNFQQQRQQQQQQQQQQNQQ